MKTRLTLFAFLCLQILSFKLHSQDDIKNYKQPDVSDGSSLLISANPSYNNENSSLDTSASFNINTDVNYIKWRFTPKYNYAFNVSAFGNFSRNSSNTGVRTNGAFYLDINGGASYFVIKNKFYIGTYLSSYNQFNGHTSPYNRLSIYPNIGYGKIVNAFIITETSNFENILFKENYISKKLTKGDKVWLNSILDKRNNSEFITNFKDNSEIVFFTELEEALLSRGIITKPLNARTTMELYQSITNNNFLYFPRFRGFQLQAELQQTYSRNNYSNRNYSAINFSSIYGIPLNMKLGVVASAFLSFPLNNDSNNTVFDFSFHSPLVIQDIHQIRSFSNGLKPDIYDLGSTSYSYKAGAVLSAYYYINNKAGLVSTVKYLIGKKRYLNNIFDYSIDINTTFLYNIIAKLNAYSSVGFRKNYYYNYSFSINGGISYYIF